MILKNLNIDNSWSLFLDRDGVINKKKDNDYVKEWIEFKFLPGSLEALKKLNTLFGTIVIVTNQQGIGKGLYRTEDLEMIHKNMLYEIDYMKGRIDKVYFSPYKNEDNHPTRKPGTGMAELAKKDFPTINFSKSIMVGDSMTDMEFGKKTGMTTVFISEEKKEDPKIDFWFKSLLAFSNEL